MEDHPPNCLPQEIIYNIFSRLPVESVLDSKLVCKPLRNILQIRSSRQLIRKIKSTRWINLKFPVDVFGIVGSCNGLICFSVETEKYKGICMPGRFHHTDEPFYICNPVTREYANLPELPTDDDKNGSSSSAYIVHGFGYHPLTNEYKVIRIFFTLYRKVYTLGSGSGSGWKSAGEVCHYLHCFSGFAKSVCVDGSFYWLREGSRDILAFDLADEKFYWLLPPPETTTTGYYKLCVMSGCLCLVHEYPESDDMFMFRVSDLWFYTKVNEGETTSSSSTYHTKEEHYWNRRFGPLDANAFNMCCFFQTSCWWVPTLHINSFVSLRTLGEQCQDIYRMSGSSIIGILCSVISSFKA
ncbi:hypothetical protein MKX01_013176 [Papaver californicum]|nr:hypothetical protein MKX01_013176 [Papaver californicum]